MRKKDVLSSPRLLELKKKRKQDFWKKVTLYSVVLILVMVGLTYASRASRLNINQVVVSGNKVIDAEAIKSVIDADLAGEYFWLFPKTNFALYPKNKIDQDLRAQFARLKDITYSVQGHTTLNVVVGEREGKYLWCGESLPEDDTADTDHKCYFMDEAGYIFDTAPYFSGDVYFKFYGMTSDSVDPVGSTFIPGAFLDLTSFKDTLRGMGLKPTSLYVTNEGDMNMFLSSDKDVHSSPKIIFKNDSDLDKIASNFDAALDTEPFKTNFTSKYKMLEYIDLSFGNKVYYKFTTDSAPIIPTAPSLTP